MIRSPRMSGGRRLPAEHSSLALGVPPGVPGTIHALGIAGGVTFGPKEGRAILFGRNRPDVHVCIGENDRRISRRHGSLHHHIDTWWLRNTGRVPLRLPGSRLLFAEDEPIPLAPGYTPVFVQGSRDRQYVFELHVSGPNDDRPADCPEHDTLPPTIWRLSPTERLVLTVLAQQYLMHEKYPHPLSWRDTAKYLALLQPDAGWTPKQVERMVGKIRSRLSRKGVTGLTRKEVGEPVGNMLNHNLIRELMGSTTLVPLDLQLLD
ncbi:MAG: FHA domain-containing protein [Pseudonocardiaceae bacterium]